MGNNSNSSSCDSSSGTTNSEDLQKELEEVKKKLCKHYYTLKIKNIRWGLLGIHRILELHLYCEECNKNSIVLIDKRTDGKHISYEGEQYKKEGWKYYNYVPENKTYVDCILALIAADDDYNIFFNNCKDFANEAKKFLMEHESMKKPEVEETPLFFKRRSRPPPKPGVDYSKGPLQRNSPNIVIPSKQIRTYEIIKDGKKYHI